MSRVKKLTILLGALLLLTAAGLFLFQQIGAAQAEKKVETLLEALYAALPEIKPGTPDDRVDVSMPVLEAEGVNFAAILEVPMFDCKLPVSSPWSEKKLRSYPCRFYGSLYDGTLIIGGSDQTGQLDFLERIDIGHTVMVTDMTGARYSYAVYRVDRAGHADAEVLMKEEASLVLFARDSFSLEYIIVRCR